MLLRFDPAGALGSIREQELDLGVYAAQIVSGPFFEEGEEALVQAQQEFLLFAHCPPQTCAMP
jgi:hypothetical protein